MFSIGSASKFFSFYKALPSYHQTHSQEHKLYPNAGIREQKLNSKPAFGVCVFLRDSLVQNHFIINALKETNSKTSSLYFTLSCEITLIPTLTSK